MTDHKQARERALTLAALSGLKIAFGPAFLAKAQGWPSGRSWLLAAMGEMVLDKMGVFPPRWRPSLLIPHTAAGAWTAHESLKADGVDDPSTVALAAAVAAGVAVAAPVVRIALNRGIGIPDALLALAEDYIALRAGTRVTGLSMDEIGRDARGSLEHVRGQVMPTLQSVGVGA